MAFLEQRIDSRITAGATGGPTVPGRVRVYTTSGHLKQNFAASLPIHRYDLSHGIRSAAAYQQVLDLWYVVNFTPYEGFRFKDWRDYQLTQANSRLTLVSGSDYQINRVHTFGGVDLLRPIYKPTGTITIKRDRTGTITDASATVDSTTGVATIAGHSPGDTYTAVGEFDIPVTFSDDEWMAELEVHTENLHVVSGSIRLEEIRL